MRGPKGCGLGCLVLLGAIVGLGMMGALLPRLSGSSATHMRSVPTSRSLNAPTLARPPVGTPEVRTRVPGARSAAAVYPEFERALRRGEDCRYLFTLKNEPPSNDRLVVRMNEELRRVGCVSSTATRTDR
jgi:hypothetical protein